MLGEPVVHTDADGNVFAGQIVGVDTAAVKQPDGTTVVQPTGKLLMLATSPTGVRKVLAVAESEVTSVFGAGVSLVRDLASRVDTALTSVFAKIAALEAKLAAVTAPGAPPAPPTT
jgi:hypothetical protein